MKPTLTDSIRGEITKYGNRSDDVRKALALCPATYYKRIRNPDTFTAREIRILRRFISDETCDAITK